MTDIYVEGSMAYDRIMTFPGRFADFIMPDKIHMLNVSFTISSIAERPGGTAGNIAYCLSLLGEKPTILAAIGHDHQRYFEWMATNGISPQGIRIIESEFTAGAYITTDQNGNQITGFNSGAMKHPSHYNLSCIDPQSSIGIIAAGNLEDMIAYRNTFAARGVDFIFDPAQSLPLWEARQLTDALTGARILISNDYELGLITKITGLEKDALLTRVAAIITTKAEHGSVVTTKDGDVVVPAIPVGPALVDPTGAGDAYRGGLIKGLLQRKNLVPAAQMGTICASFCVQVQGTQEYRFTIAEFEARLKKHFS